MQHTDAIENALAPHIRLIRLHAEAAVLRRLNAGYGFVDTRIPAEIYLHEPEARERMRRDSLRPEDTHLGQAEEIAEAIAETEAALAGHASRLTLVGERFGLDAAERALLCVAVAYELDPDVRELCHTLAWRRRAALFADVCQELAPELARTGELLRILHPGGALRRGCLIELEGDGPERRGHARPGSALALGRHMLGWLLGDERIAEPLHAAIRIYDVEHDFHVHVPRAVQDEIERVAGLIARAGALAAVTIQGPLGAGKRAVAHRLAARLGRPLAAAPLRALLDAQDRARDTLVVRQALAEARLRNAIPYLPGANLLGSGDGEHGAGTTMAADAIDQHADVLILATTERGAPSLPLARPFHLIRLPAASLEIRQAAWVTGLAALRGESGSDVSESAAAELAARYVIGPGTIGEVVDDARAFSRATGSPASLRGVEEAVARRLTMRLGSFGTLISRRARLEDLVLPPDVIESIKDIIAMVRERTQILEGWGYGKHLSLSRGVSALFSGEPGTGKTMAASVISSALGLELIRIDLSAVTSKWVGETEKHLAKIFDEAQTANAMLLFDEADSLFGKRTELKSAQDRYANLEVNYVLQRMETFDGVSVLTTNMETAIDAAFQRRLNFRIRFPRPEVEERMELWRRLLPPETGLADKVDFESLAERFEMSGGHIRNAIVRAAVIAAREGRAMSPSDLSAGAHHEYVEMGKVMPSLT